MAGKPAFPVSADENPSFDLSYTGSQLDFVDMTVNGTVYRKTLTWTGSNLTAVTVWVKQ